MGVRPRTASVLLALVALAAPLAVTIGLAEPAAAESFGGANGKIAYSKAPDQFTTDFDIYVVNPDGTGEVQLTSGPAFDLEPNWSPDGTRIAFTRRVGLDSNIWIMNADGSGQTQITSGPAADDGPSWSPDGTRLLFHSNRDDIHGDIFEMFADGSGITNLTPSVGRPEINGSFSPDGTQIVFMAPIPTTNRYDIWIMNDDGTGQTDLTNANPADNTSHSDPNWSPDGSRIIFTTTRPGDAVGSHVYTIAPDGTGLTRLTNDPVVDASPTYSPDGSRILLIRRIGDFDLYTMAPDGTDLQVIEDNTPDHDVTPNWQPIPSADLSLVKTTPTTQVVSGGTITYTLTITNNGRSGSPMTSIIDTIPPGLNATGLDPGCLVLAGTVRCAIGFLPAGASATRHLTFTVSPGYVGTTDASTNHNHQFTVNKVETHVSVDAGQTRTGVVQCPGGTVLTDGSWRIDSVDSGQPEDLLILEAQSNGSQDYLVTIKNQTPGTAQFKVFGVCVNRTTSVNDGHSHTITTNGPQDTTVPVAVGTRVLTLSCAPGELAVAPGYRLFSAEAVLNGSSPINDGQAWRFTFGVTTAGTLRASIWCLPVRTSTDAGHSHSLVTGLRTRTVSVPGNSTVSETVSCPDDAKGIVASWEVDGPMSFLGNDPEPKSRVFRLHNRSANPYPAQIGLICLADRTGLGSSLAAINHACANGAYLDPNPGNDCDDVSTLVVPEPHGLVTIGATVTVLNPGASGNPRLTAARRAVSVPITCHEAKGCRGRVWVTASVRGRTVTIAKQGLALASGQRRDVRLNLTNAGRKSFARWSDDKRVKVKVLLDLPGTDQLVKRKPRLDS